MWLSKTLKTWSGKFNSIRRTVAMVLVSFSHSLFCCHTISEGYCCANVSGTKWWSFEQFALKILELTELPIINYEFQKLANLPNEQYWEKENFIFHVYFSSSKICFPSHTYCSYAVGFTILFLDPKIHIQQQTLSSLCTWCSYQIFD